MLHIIPRHLETSILNVAATSRPHGKKFGADAAPSDEAVAFSGGELCDYAFGYAAFPLWVSS